MFTSDSDFEHEADGHLLRRAIQYRGAERSHFQLGKLISKRIFRRRVINQTFVSENITVERS